MPGRGGKRQPWVEYVHDFFDDEFERMLDFGVKVTRYVLRVVALDSFTVQKILLRISPLVSI